MKENTSMLFSWIFILCGFYSMQCVAVDMKEFSLIISQCSQLDTLSPLDSNEKTRSERKKSQRNQDQKEALPRMFKEGAGVTDVDGKYYTSIIIQDQEWMQHNLSVGRYRNGDLIPTDLNRTQWQVTKEGAYAIDRTNALYDSLYGKLYNWYAVNDERGLCPLGWHVPSDQDWTILEMNVGMEAGTKLKSAIGWKEAERRGWRRLFYFRAKKKSKDLNSFGFSALPGGMKTMFDEVEYMGLFGYWWTSTAYDESVAFDRQLYYSLPAMVKFWGNNKFFGYSVRCIKDQL
jgi:uncharacterized protein (TIGR02145 family)